MRRKCLSLGLMDVLVEGLFISSARQVCNPTETGACIISRTSWVVVQFFSVCFLSILSEPISARMRMFVFSNRCDRRYLNATKFDSQFRGQPG